MPLILILDDRMTNRSIYGRLATLIAEDVVVESFSDPLDALEWLAHNPVDLVITDYKMPGIDGAEFTRRLRAMAGGADTPVIVVTAYDDRSFRLHALEAGATDFLQSPVDHFEFVARARNLLALPRNTSAMPAASSGAPSAEGPAELALGIDDLPALITVTDRSGRCVFANRRQAGLADGCAGTAPGQDNARGLGAERVASGRMKDQEVLDTGQEIAPYREARHGQARLLTAKAPLRDASGAIVGVVSISLELPGPASFAASDDDP